jgi:adenosine deaminase
LSVNYRNKVFYLDVKGKPGNINRDVKFGQRLYINSRNVVTYDKFIEKLTPLVSSDKDIPESCYNFMYRQYSRIKCETDIIMKTLYTFNTTHAPISFIENDQVLADIHNVYLKENFDSNSKPQMMVQFVITLSKKPKEIPLDIRAFTLEAKIMLYVAVIINEEYGYPIFNGFDLVGNEQTSRDLQDFIPIINKILYFRKYNISFFPHIGESSISRKQILKIDDYLFKKNVLRIGHGIALVSCGDVIDYLKKNDKKLIVESCPISNYILGYFNPKMHPHKTLINCPQVVIVLCSDDNGVFGYSTVSNDYYFVYRYWNLKTKDIKKIILNGIYCIPPKYRNYYLDLFNYMWKNFEFNL